MFGHKFMRAVVIAILTLLTLYLFMRVQPLLLHTYQIIMAIVTPFLIALVISYLLHPVVSMLERRKVPRPIAVLLIYAVFCTSVSIVLLHFIPMVVAQLDELNRSLPAFTKQVEQLLHQWNDSTLIPEPLQGSINTALARVEKWIATMLMAIVYNVDAVINFIFIMAIVPFLTFYLLKDFDRLERFLLRLVPHQHRQVTIELVRVVDKALGHYVRGQLLVCLVVGTLAYVGYLWIDMPYPLLLALAVALTNVIPYIGPLFGAAPAIIVASTISIKMLLLVLLVNVICQLVESNVVGPQIVGRSLDLHPLVIIFALLVGGELFGVVGLLFAVPVYAAVKVATERLSELRSG